MKCASVPLLDPVTAQRGRHHPKNTPGRDAPERKKGP